MRPPGNIAMEMDENCPFSSMISKWFKPIQNVILCGNDSICFKLCNKPVQLLKVPLLWCSVKPSGTAVPVRMHPWQHQNLGAYRRGWPEFDVSMHPDCHDQHMHEFRATIKITDYKERTGWVDVSYRFARKVDTTVCVMVQYNLQGTFWSLFTAPQPTPCCGPIFTTTSKN